MRLKRIFDVAVSVVAGFVLLPIMVAIAVVTLLDSGWPVFFWQQRVGLRFAPFSIWKFRTMHAGAKGASVTLTGDPRITRAGRFLRRWKLDELPQLWNVIRGDMSLVGPRPEVPDFVPQFQNRYRKVWSVRPGMTDIASIVYRQEGSLLAAADDPVALYTQRLLPAKLTLAEQYIDTRTFMSDLFILIRTVGLIARSARYSS